jgi:lipoate-protein ligase A
MAADEALTMAGDLPILRAYQWRVPAVSFGYFGEYAKVISRWPGREPVRRWTGGGEVPHGEDFTYAISVPRSDSFVQHSVGESYRMIHEALAHCIPGAQLATSDAAQNPACFARPVSADVLVDNRKVAGAAQRRGRFGLLHQGSVQGVSLLNDFERNFAALLAHEVIPFQYSPTLLEKIERLADTRYGTEEWLKRR